MAGYRVNFTYFTSDVLMYLNYPPAHEYGCDCAAPYYLVFWMRVKCTKEGTSLLDYMSRFEHTLIDDKLDTIDFAGFYGCPMTTQRYVLLSPSGLCNPRSQVQSRMHICTRTRRQGRSMSCFE